VLFVHGLGGDGRETWTAASDAFWPLWIFEDLKTVKVWTLEYPASMFGSANGSLVISDQAKQVLDLLGSHSIGKRPLYAGEGDKEYFSFRRHVLKANVPVQLTCGATFDGSRLNLDLSHLRNYSHMVKLVLEHFL
jgi:hypothetical protein